MHSVKITGGQWSKPLFCSPGGHFNKGVTLRENINRLDHKDKQSLNALIIFNLHVENGKIQINTANYGRTDKTTCSEGRPSEQLQNTNCYSPNALAPVSKR